jgi:predicted Ser/Thr protein kinase
MTTPAGDSEKTLRIDPSDVPFTPRHRGEDGQFAPGTIIAGRYRVSSILGSGGMGEVYRAEDTKLGQTVALKFLPVRLARDPILLERLHEEVRLGRQISHPNVCRIYDIVEADGAHFVAMEYVDGEDLSRLLQRIGRLAHDKAVDITRGIAAGLAAAHAKGILHRDLKPPNVMVDARGDARIMDFGLANVAGEHDGTISGTPAYMAPEQLEGRAPSVQSDLYALGLVMYELFTGKRAHSARSMNDRIRDITSEITTPSAHIRDLDPAVERVILRCLSNDPAQRPRSAREVIAALPGGDPLQAALAAGETPSPRIVAAAGTEGSLRPRTAWALLAIVIVCAAMVIAGRQRFSATHYVSFEKTSEVQAERASTILRTLGIAEQPFSEYDYTDNEQYYAWIMRNPSPQRWERLRDGPPLYVFRLIEGASPQPVRRSDIVRQPGTTVAGIDTDGRLFSLESIPLHRPAARKLDWNPLIAATGLDPKTFTPATPRFVPPTVADTHVAWSGRWRDGVMPVHVEAAAWMGTPVFLRISGPWASASADSLPFSSRSTAVLSAVLFLAVIAAGLALAWRNVRMRRGDRGSALRIAGTMVVLELASRLLLANHQRSGMHTVSIIRDALAEALLWGAVAYVLYLALEPFVRRRWPEQLIASTRLLSGNYRDPMVGRDVMMGLVAGLSHTALIMVSRWTGSNALLFDGTQRPRLGLRFGAGVMFSSLGSGIIQGFITVVLLVTLTLLLRNRIAAAFGVFAVMIGGYVAVGASITVWAVLMIAIMTFVFARYGLVAAAMTHTSFHWIFHYPLFNGPEWHTLNLMPLIAIAALTFWAFRTSLGSQSPFSRSLLEE